MSSSKSFEMAESRFNSKNKARGPDENPAKLLISGTSRTSALQHSNFIFFTKPTCPEAFSVYAEGMNSFISRGKYMKFVRQVIATNLFIVLSLVLGCQRLLK